MEVRGQLVGVSSTMCIPRIELGLAGNCSYLLGHLADPQILSSSLPPLLPSVRVVFACVCVLVQGNDMQRPEDDARCLLSLPALLFEPRTLTESEACRFG